MPPLPSPALYRLAANREYTGIPDRVASHPQDLFWTDRYGSTALHILCQVRSSTTSSSSTSSAGAGTSSSFHNNNNDNNINNNNNTKRTTTPEEPQLLRAVDAMVRVAPDLVRWANVSTWTPLHFAVEARLGVTRVIQMHTTENEDDDNNNENHNNSNDAPDLIEEDDDDDENDEATAIVLRLIEACPRAVSVATKRGYKTKTPFHIACEANADYKVLERMLQIDPSLATMNFTHRQDPYATTTAIENPLQLIWKHNNTNHQHRHPDPREAARTRDKMALLLRAAQERILSRNYNNTTIHHHHHSSQQQQPNNATATLSPSRLLAAACSIRCPRPYFSLVLEQTKAVTDTAPRHEPSGNLPLHFAVERFLDYNNHHDDNNTMMMMMMSGHNHHHYYQSAPSQLPYTQFVIEELIRAFPHQQGPNRAGCWPLHYATVAALTWHKGGVRQLVADAPEALGVPHPESQLVPVLMSAVTAGHTRMHLSTTLELLLAAPEVLQQQRERRAPRRRNTDAPVVTRTNPTATSHLGVFELLDDGELGTT